MSSEEDSSLDVEIEALKAIYIHELEVSCDESKRPTCVKVSLHPATADNAEEQYVRLDLVLDIPTEYPDVSPEITIRNPRGLSDEKITKIQQELEDTAQENVGGPMLYQLIEVAKEHLTQENIPCCQCTICLYGFAEGDVFTKTQCYHYFHSHCLARYLRHALEQLAQEEADKPSQTPATAATADGGNKDTAVTKVVCPVCRLPLSPLLGLAEQEHPPPVEQQRQPDFYMTAELEQLQRSMAQLYVRQQRQGGIINVDAEKNKFLLEISVAPESNNAPETPKRFGAFKLRGWGPPLRHTSNIPPAQTTDDPLHGLPDRQLEPQFPRPSKNRHSRPAHRQQRGANESYDKHHVSNGYFEHSGGSSSSSGAERLQRSDTDQKPRRPRPHHRGRGGAAPAAAAELAQTTTRSPRRRRQCTLL
uniref:E3 ubiquitin-protein ligase RNF25 n=1 Tax=Amblyomma triste TaxID=251400 RepID=A0A023GFT0_AMBTT